MNAIKFGNTKQMQERAASVRQTDCQSWQKAKANLTIKSLQITKKNKGNKAAHYWRKVQCNGL